MYLATKTISSKNTYTVIGINGIIHLDISRKIKSHFFLNGNFKLRKFMESVFHYFKKNMPMPYLQK